MEALVLHIVVVTHISALVVVNALTDVTVDVEVVPGNVKVVVTDVAEIATVTVLAVVSVVEERITLVVLVPPGTKTKKSILLPTAGEYLDS